MSLDFYDRVGRPYLYSDDGEHLFTFPGKPIAYIYEGGIYSYDGKYLCFLENNVIWDKNGDTILFGPDPVGGPLKPLKQLKPLKGLKELKPLKGLRELRPMKPLKTLSWSRSTPEQVFEQL